ncbi:beta strand repeat-containing protein [Bradyrhizobium arachidis]|uniref:Calcium-binding protein n=1 Tax=Bradyrhizobium arachidis TaxID=858423 RepID=A0AAE7NR00_9BRAD|nr:calcium-binding protein [Bradyrhizobium arachidis]QOZ68735.1 calcium-binding protein [Bradyrhizobium arachidis]SFV05692.1 Hemolysin-type calcium-binding repeat-containing protein [Bradyrhizobium arachidis]
MSVTSVFSPVTGQLTIFGDGTNNGVVIGRDKSGRILVNNGSVKTAGGDPTVANTNEIDVFGQGGDDTITVNESNGPMPAVHVFGGDGNDKITGGSGADLLFGQAGDDTIKGGGGNDLLFGGAGNDTLDGGSGDNQLFGEAGNDLMIWNPGGGTNLFEGGDGIDTAQVNGSNDSETFTIVANGTRVRFDGTGAAPFSLDIGTTENLVLHAGGGDDVITAGNGLAPLISLTLDGGAGNDRITGGDGNDLLIGGSGDDIVNGGRGNDVAQLGSGDDTFIWNPGDGSDTVEGGSGNDKLLFNGANINEKIDISANGGRVRFTRDVANITMDLNSVEQIEFDARGGADSINVGDLTGTGVKQVLVDLGATPGGTQGDGAADTVTVNGTNGNQHITVTAVGTTVTVTGLPEVVTIANAEGANDRLVIQALGGNDVIDASALPAVIGLTIDGGAGNDTITGSQGADLLIGGDGNDKVTGGRGNDVADLGAGDDLFTWNPGDGSDTVEGGAGTDTLVFNGSNVAENMSISANGTRTLLTRDVGAIVMDLDGVEHVQIAAAGGADNITVNDLTGTGVTQVAIDLSASPGSTSGDGAADRVTVDGSAGDDNISVTTSGSSIAVNGLAAQVTIAHSDAGDVLSVNGGAGNDVINASTIKPGQPFSLDINGGDGNDTITGSAGNDIVNGGRGNDVANLGAGDDTFVWNPGDGSDVVEGGKGTDTLQFNGANISENINISANGGRVLFTRDVAAIALDLNGVEHINFNALGGADNITVGDLSGTGVNQINLDLGASDGAADTVNINGTSGSDVITVTEHDGIITVSGLGQDINITDAGAGDRIVINGLDGDDVITASGLHGGIQLVANGGNGDDILIGGSGNDTLTGGAGDDVLIGGGGADVLDGGSGSNVVIQGGAFAAAMLLNQAMAASFAPAGDGHGEMPLSDPHTAQTQTLAPPQHA